MNIGRDGRSTGPQGDPEVPILSIHGLFVEYATPAGSLSAVRDVSLEVGRGETVALVGESGSGKSTIAYATMRYLPRNGRITRGRIAYAGNDMTKMSFDELQRLRGRHICLVPQNPASSLNPSMRVGDQIIEILRHHFGMPKGEASARAIEMLRRVRLADPATIARKYPHQLSGGQQQRVVIAMAFATNPDVLVFDEPTTGLDVVTEAHILDLIRDMQKDSGTAILYITHNLAVVRKFCHRIVILYAGEVIENGLVAEVFGRALHPYTRMLLQCLPGGVPRGTPLETIPGFLPDRTDVELSSCVFVSRCRLAEARCGEARPPLEAVRTRHEARCYLAARLPPDGTARHEPSDRRALPARPCRVTGEPLLSVENVSKQFRVRNRGIDALDQVSVKAHRGEILGIVGESGSGKSTLARAIAGLVDVDAGRIVFDGVDAAAALKRGNRAVRRRIQMVFQDPERSLNPQRTVEQILARPLDLYGLHTGKERRPALHRLLEAVHIEPDYLARLPHELSSGEQQRAAVARVLAVEPDLILCDEPTSNLDVSVQASILNLFMDIRRKYGMSIVFISHDLDAVGHISDTIVVMRTGSICDAGRLESLIDRSRDAYTRELFSYAYAFERADERPAIRPNTEPDIRPEPPG